MFCIMLVGLIVLSAAWNDFGVQTAAEPNEINDKSLREAKVTPNPGFSITLLIVPVKK